MDIIFEFMATEKQLKANKKNAEKAGRPKGAKSPKTLDKEASLERIRQRVFAMSDKLINAQAVVAMGTYKMVRPYIGTDGLPKTETIRDMDDMEKLIQEGTLGKDYLIVEASAPDHKAADALLNRAYGKPTESIEHSGKDGAPLLIKLDK